MLDFSKIGDNSIIVCPSVKIESLVRYQMDKYPTKHIKYMSKEELEEGAYYKYDLSSIHWLHENYYDLMEPASDLDKKLEYDQCCEILENLIDVKKVRPAWAELFERMEEEGVIYENPLFPELFKAKEIYVYGYLKKDVELPRTFNKLGIKFTYLSDIPVNIKPHTIYTYSTMEEEVRALFCQIMKLVKEKGPDIINKIYLYKYDDTYENILKRYAYYHNLIIEDFEPPFLEASPLFKHFIRNLKRETAGLDDNSRISNETIYQVFAEVAEETQRIKTIHNEEEEEDWEKNIILDQYDALGSLRSVLTILKDIPALGKEDYLKLCFFAGTIIKMKKIHYDRSIKIVTKDSVVLDDEYVFMLGFSAGIYPFKHRDNDLLTDGEKEKIQRNTSQIENYIEVALLSNFLRSTANVHISHKERLGNEKFDISDLADKLKMPVEKGEIDHLRYSKKMAEIEVSKYKDLRRVYGIETRHVDTFNDQQIRYNSFDHSFKGLLNYRNEAEMKVSYTAIDDYNVCPFKYYVKRVLKAGPIEDNFYLHFGDLFHHVLKDSLDKEIDYADYQTEIMENFVNEKERYLAAHLIKQADEVIKKNAQLLRSSKFTRAIAESEYETRIDEITTLYGKIDKIVFNDKDKEMYCVDYKTGKYEFKAEHIPYGLDLQLPLYGYLLRQAYPEYCLVGLYIQTVYIDKTKELKKKEIPYHLNGLTLLDEDVIMRLDQKAYFEKKNYCSEYFGKLNYQKDPIKNKKLGNTREQFQFDELFSEAETQLKKSIENIRKGNFPIKPKKDKSKDLSCSNCLLNNICYHDSLDIFDIGQDSSKEAE